MKPSKESFGLHQLSDSGRHDARRIDRSRTPSARAGGRLPRREAGHGSESGRSESGRGDRSSGAASARTLARLSTVARLASSSTPILVASFMIYLASVGCDTGTPRSQIPGVTQSAPKLEEFDPRGNYTPYYATAEMNQARYFCTSILGNNGRVFTFGGSEERGLASLDSVEIYDQSTVAKDAVIPESGSGVWIDTDFEGEPIVMPSGGRMFFTVNTLSDNRILVVGGTTNILASAPHTKVEIFDPVTRKFDTLEAELNTPRFRHSTATLASGELLIVGGQIQATLTIENEDIPQGEPGRQQQVTVFPTTRDVEVYSPRENDFRLLTTINGDRAVMQTQRGRADFDMTRLAGPDNRLNGSDDVYVIVGGFQTLSAQSGQAPRSKTPGAVGRNEADGLTTIEVFDPQTNIFTLIASVKLTIARINSPQVVNLGLFNDFTPDGVRGMANSILVTGGNDDNGAVPFTPIIDHVFVANYQPGAGPAQGIRLVEVLENRFLSYVQNSEYPGPQFPAAGVQVGRCAHEVVSVPRPVQTVQGVQPRGTWAFALGGVDTFPLVFNYATPAMLSGCVFDPYFSVPAFRLFNLDPTDLENQRRSDPLNFLGIVGAWLTIDGFVTSSVSDYGTTPESRWAKHKGRFRVFYNGLAIPGVDGIRNTFDDRILMIGGGQDYPLNGGEPTNPSAEIFLPPGAAGV
jgi:hypothetical protein